MSPSISVRLLLTQSDERLVGYARAGHERAFEALVQRYRRQLHCYCRRLLLSEERAEDALQQALLQAWVALRDGIEVRDARAWLYRIVHNTAVNALRTSGYDYCTLSESLSGADAPQDDLDRRIAVREALAGLAALPSMQREALLRTAIEGRSHLQVAGDLGLSEPAVRGLVYRARSTLRAAASAIVPPPLLSWALEAGTRGGPALEGLTGAAGGSAGIAGLLVKGGAVAVTAGAVASGIVAANHRPRGVRGPTIHAGPSAQSRREIAPSAIRPVAFAQPSTHRRRPSVASWTPSRRPTAQRPLTHAQRPGDPSRPVIKRRSTPRPTSVSPATSTTASTTPPTSAPTLTTPSATTHGDGHDQARHSFWQQPPTPSGAGQGEPESSSRGDSHGETAGNPHEALAANEAPKDGSGGSEDSSGGDDWTSSSGRTAGGAGSQPVEEHEHRSGDRRSGSD